MITYISDETYRSRHESSIADLERRFPQFAEIGSHYMIEVKRLEKKATLRDFIPVFAERHIREQAKDLEKRMQLVQ